MSLIAALRDSISLRDWGGGKHIYSQAKTIMALIIWTLTLYIKTVLSLNPGPIIHMCINYPLFLSFSSPGR